MKQNWQLAITLVITVLMLSCSGEKSSQSEKEVNDASKGKEVEKTELKHKPIDVDTIQLSLNDGEPWKLDSMTKIKMASISNEIKQKGRTLKKMDGRGFQKFGSKLDQKLDKIGNENALKGEGSKAFNTLLNHMKREAQVLRKGDKKPGQVAVVNLSELMKVYREHFQ